jgi:ABC-type transport system involved in multi-copper enzyme maturation permease subunit
MIWLAWRRHRLALIVVGGALAALALWLFIVAHSFEEAMHSHPHNGCIKNLIDCNGVSHGVFALQNQAGFLSLFLFLVPCLLGVVLGAPLVAGEIQQRTNRLAWTQNISRTRWLAIKWLVVGVIAMALVALLQILVQWWSGHVLINFLETGSLLGSNRITPRLFGVTGVVPIAYTFFAFALGAALGAIFRRTVWAVVGTIVVYGAATALMVFNIRAYQLSSPIFVQQKFTLSGPSVTYVPQIVLRQPAWNLGYSFRLAPGFSSASSANEIAQRCQDQNYNFAPYLHCLAAHHVEAGSFFQPANRYWQLQWSEAAIYVAAALVLFGLALWAVRRWRA